ncbi:helix-turn-helix domain-containing protein [Streptomyces sp. ME18-1-4]|uniref:helix-turn-helix domain-containing protein n=1 Tax=Streptomyces sp. ME18-1-4 TaxID=3028685 RepID=UPI0029BB7F58|nr:helix-turn-helix domain-containing protein [Streptomyces sp. ME18-1-4]MDX3246469.1 helix-turn-helix domain-containing protein [Streptomyces sp. ME18-1-4]
MDIQQLAEYRYRAVREVLGGSAIGEVAARYGTSRQTLHSWRRRFEQEGMPGLLDRSARRGTDPLVVPRGVGEPVDALLVHLDHHNAKDKLLEPEKGEGIGPDRDEPFPLAETVIHYWVHCIEAFGEVPTELSEYAELMKELTA